jgi:hypothetical protein
MIVCNRCLEPIFQLQPRVTQPIIGSDDLHFHLRCFAPEHNETPKQPKPPRGLVGEDRTSPEGRTRPT